MFFCKNKTAAKAAASIGSKKEKETKGRKETDSPVDSAGSLNALGDDDAAAKVRHGGKFDGGPSMVSAELSHRKHKQSCKIDNRKIKKQQRQQDKDKQRHGKIRNHVDCYDQYCNNDQSRTNTDTGGVLEEYDIASDISGLTRDSEFTITRTNEEVEEKENRCDSSNGHKKSKSKEKSTNKADPDTTQVKSSALLSNLTFFGNTRARRVRTKERKTKRGRQQSKDPLENQVRAKSFTPDRGHAASLLSKPSKDMEMSIMESPLKVTAKLCHKRSKSADPITRKQASTIREPSPTRLAHPPIQYQMERMEMPSSLNTHHIVSPEPIGTKLDDYAFRSPHVHKIAPYFQRNRAEPLGVRLDPPQPTNPNTPTADEIYIDMETPPSFHRTALPKSPLVHSFHSRVESVNAMYHDVDMQNDGHIECKRTEIEETELEAQLPSLARSNSSTKSSDRQPKETLPEPTLDHEISCREPWVHYDPYMEKARERMRSRLEKSSTYRLHESPLKQPDRQYEGNAHDPPVVLIEGDSEEEVISSLDIDKSDSFDWKGFANYLDKRAEKVLQHRSKYRSLLDSPQRIDVALAASMESPTLTHNQSTPVLNNALSIDRDQRKQFQSRSKEFLEFSPRKCGGFLQATCFKESKFVTRLNRERENVKTESGGNELVWMNGLGEEPSTITRNYSHDLNVYSRKISSEQEEDIERIVTEKKLENKISSHFSTLEKQDTKRKDRIDTIDIEASKRSLRSSLEMNDPEACNFHEDVLAGLYPIRKEVQIKKNGLADHSDNETAVVRQLPFQVIHSPRKQKCKAVESKSFPNNGTLGQFSIRNKVQVSMSTGQRKKLISDYLSARDGRTSKKSADPPESSFASRMKPRIVQLGRKPYEDYEMAYSSPTLGISPKSVVEPPDYFDYLEPSNVADVCGDSQGTKLKTSFNTPRRINVTPKNTEQCRDMVSRNHHNDRLTCLPLYNLRAMKRFQDSRFKNVNNRNSGGYVYLSSSRDESQSAASSIHVKTVLTTAPNTVTSIAVAGTADYGSRRPFRNLKKPNIYTMDHTCDKKRPKMYIK